MNALVVHFHSNHTDNSVHFFGLLLGLEGSSHARQHADEPHNVQSIPTNGHQRQQRVPDCQNGHGNGYIPLWSPGCRHILFGIVKEDSEHNHDDDAGEEENKEHHDAVDEVEEVVAETCWLRAAHTQTQREATDTRRRRQITDRHTDTVKQRDIDTQKDTPVLLRIHRRLTNGVLASIMRKYAA